MPHDSADHPKEPADEKQRRRSQTDLPEELAADVDPATSTAEDEDEARLPELPEADRALAAGLAEGSIGRALSILEAGGVELYRDLVALLLALPKLDAGALHRQAERLARSGSEESYRLAAELLLGWLTRMIKLAAAGGDAGSEFLKGERAAMTRLGRGVSVARWIELAEEMRREFSLVEGVNLDRRQVWISSLLGVQRLTAA